MTANDFYLLFIAFAGFVGAPALIVWGIVRLTGGWSKGAGGSGTPTRRESRPQPDRHDRHDEAQPSRYADSKFGGSNSGDLSRAT